MHGALSVRSPFYEHLGLFKFFYFWVNIFCLRALWQIVVAHLHRSHARDEKNLLCLDLLHAFCKLLCPRVPTQPATNEVIEELACTRLACSAQARLFSLVGPACGCHPLFSLFAPLFGGGFRSLDL